MAKIKMKQHANTYEVLTNAGFTPSQPLQYRKVLATSEQGRKIRLKYQIIKKRLCLMWMVISLRKDRNAIN